MKIAGIILAVLVILFIGFMGYRTIYHMVNGDITLGEGMKIAWNELINLKFNDTVKDEMLASRDAEYGIEYKGLRTIE